SAGLLEGLFGLEAETDASGRFEWVHVPIAQTILLDIFKPGFRTVRQRAVDRESGTITIALHRPQRLHGTVTDAETGRPIERFTLTPAVGPNSPDDRPQWEPDVNAKSTLTHGQFDMSRFLFEGGHSRQSIRIEAEGYQPAELLGFPESAEDVA